MQVEKTKTLELKCCLLDTDGAVRDDTEIKLINWTPAENPTSSDRELLREKLDTAFDTEDVQWPYKTAVRDHTGELIPIKANNIDWEDMDTIVHNLTHDQNPKIFIQPNLAATTDGTDVPVDPTETSEGAQLTGDELATGHNPTVKKTC